VRRFLAKLSQHGVKHRAGHFVAVFGIVQRKIQDIAGPLDHHAMRAARAGKLNLFG